MTQVARRPSLRNVDDDPCFREPYRIARLPVDSMAFNIQGVAADGAMRAITQTKPASSRTTATHTLLAWTPRLRSRWNLAHGRTCASKACSRIGCANARLRVRSSLLTRGANR